MLRPHVDTPARTAVISQSLVDRCRRGDREAWRDLVSEYSRYVYAIIMRGYRLSESDAEDVFQDVFARVFERLETLRDDEALRGWIAQVTRNLCADHLRRAHPHEELSEDTVTDLDDRLSRSGRRARRAPGARAPAGRLRRDPRPLLLPRRVLQDDLARARDPVGDDREQDQPLPGALRREMGGRDPAPGASGGK